ncbi:MAG: McrB family protein [Saprospiraceae bacterium]
MAIINYEEPFEFKKIKDELILSLSLGEEYFEDVSSILMIIAIGNVVKSDRQIQKNINDVKNFFPVVLRNKYVSKWKYKLKVKVGVDIGFIVIKYGLQTEYEYAFITFEGSAQTFKRTLNIGDKIVIIKKKDSETYEMFSINKDNEHFSYTKDFFAVDKTILTSDQTYFSPPIFDNKETGNVSKKISNIILYGPPGTGKTRRLNNSYLFGKNEDSKSFITFHQAYSYEEFIEGIKPIISETDRSQKEISYEYSNGIFFQACEAASLLAGYSSLKECLAASKEDRQEKFQQAISEGNIFCFCIDEINRANIAGVFGDLITLIETNKRIGGSEEMIVSLPYSKRQFGIPANLQIIGTMNTADRSITLMDTALRRRFEFIELAPNSEVFSEQGINKIGNIDLVNLFDSINERIKHFLGKDQCIGHAYFLKLENSTSPKKDLLAIFMQKVIPLLEEYFYNDYERIRLVLGDDNPRKNEKEHCFFILNKSQNPFLTESDLVDEEKNVYSINEQFIKSLEEDAIDETIFTLMYVADESISS